MESTDSAPISRLGETGTSVAGRILQVLTAVTSTVRRAEKPLHPRGEVWNARVHRVGVAGAPTGARWLDEPGEDEGIVRISAALGLPARWPDIQGLALRVESSAGVADVLMATTGLGPMTRYLLTPGRSLDRPYTTLLPYRTARGPLHLAAVRVSAHRFALMHSRPRGTWRPFAFVDLGAPRDLEPSFDPILRPPPGLSNYRWVVLIRARAYRTARHRRGEGGASTGA